MKKRGLSASSVKILSGMSIAVLGYGSQGSAQAKNLHDYGFDPIIGLPSSSKSRIYAKKDKLRITRPINAVLESDLIAVLLPDHKHKSLFDTLPTSMLSGKTLVFAHGLSVHFGLVKPPADCDVVLVAPHGPGVRIREKYLSGEPFTTFVGIGNDASGKAEKIARAYAEAIGCPRKYQFSSTFRDEAVGDIFGEQAVLCGGLVGLMESGFDTLVKKGFSPEAAYLECIYQIDLIVDLVKKYGPAGMFNRISVTAAYGSLSKKDMLFGNEFKGKLEELYNDIESGSFAKQLGKDSRNQMASFEKLLLKSGNSELQKAHEQLQKNLNANFRGL